MFTSVDKALVAIVMAAFFLLNEFTGINTGLSEEVVSGILAALMPLLVWAIPNKTE